MFPFVILFGGCLVDTTTYETRKRELTDADGDGFILLEDCDDDDPAVNPDAAEVCDGIDQDCSGAADEDVLGAPTWYRDGDGDGYGLLLETVAACTAPEGYSSDPSDCDDADAGVAPSAAEQWYDGIDQDCDGGDDYDADGDGDGASSFGRGGDCDDEDPTIHGGAAEGWWDAGVDNNCDGSVTDQALGDVGTIGTRVAGEVANAALGQTLLVAPAGWVDDEPVLLAAAPFSGGGTVYGWRASELAGAEPGAGRWTYTGDSEYDFFGYGMGWAGAAEAGLVLLGAEGVEGGLGEVYLWDRSSWGGEPRATIRGSAAGAYFGSQIVSNHDHDGDGMADVVVSSAFDSRIATNAGAVVVFLDAPSTGDALSASDADIEFTSAYGGALLTAAALGDLDGDGKDDLGFTQDIPSESGPGGLLVTQGRVVGSYDVTEISVAQLHGGPFTFARTWDTDYDGVLELLTASGGLHFFELPLSGSVTPWEDATQSREFAEFGVPSVRQLRTDVPSYAGRGAFVASSANYSGERGMVSVQRPYGDESLTIDEAPFFALGEAAGDQAGSATELLDVDDDGVADIIVGAPGADAGALGAGALYILPGPR